MAHVIVNSKTPLIDGMVLTFKAPCDCTAVAGLKVNYPNATDDDSTEATKTFVFKDAHGNALTGIGNLFSQDAYVKVILDTVNGFAYLQNADTNSYLEGKLAEAGYDPIVDEYEETIGQTKWIVRKYKSGLAECWCSCGDAIAFSASGNLWVSSDWSVSMPTNLFTTVDAAVASLKGNPNLWLGGVTASTESITAKMYSPVSVSGSGFQVCFVVKGRWKTASFNTALLGEAIVGQAVLATGG